MDKQKARALHIFLSLGFLAGWVGVSPAAAQPAPARQVLASDATGLTLAIHTPDYEITRRERGGVPYDALTIPGETATTGEPGSPQLPSISFLVGVPPGASISLTVLQAESIPIAGKYDLPPAPTPLPLEAELTPGAMGYPRDPEGYGFDGDLPGELAVIASEAWVRQQRIVRIEVHPFQYNPARQALTWHPDIQVRIEFSSGSATVCADCPFDAETEAMLADSLVNYEWARGWRVPPRSEALHEQIQSPLYTSFLGARYEVVVEQDGIYRLTYAALQAAGMDVDNVNPQTFRLTSQGEDVAIHVFGEGDGSFDPGDYVTFYGEKFRGDIMAERYEASMTKPNNIPGAQGYAPNNWLWQCKSADCALEDYFEAYTDENVYYLLEGGAPGPRMTTRSATPGGAAVPAYYWETHVAEQSNQWFAAEFYSMDVWYWERIQNIGLQKLYTTTLTAVAPGAFTATVYGEMTSDAQNVNSSPDHHSQVTLNSVMVDDTYWDGRQRYIFSQPFPQTSLIEGVNTLGITLQADAAVFAPLMYFDHYEITYAREFEALSNALIFSYNQAGTWKYQVSGFTGGTVEVYDILNARQPVRLTNVGVSGGGPFTASFQSADGASARYALAETTSGVKTPKRITYYEPPDFEAMAEAEYVLITHANFLTATQTLADYREGQGYSVAVMDVADLYREFNDGIYNPMAIKNFLAWTFDEWDTPVRYATLIGTGHWNFKRLGAPGKTYYNPPPVYMPPNMAKVDPWQGEVPSANLLATIIGDDTLPDVYIAHIPVSTDAAMAVVVGKIIGYEAAAYDDWHRNILFIADNVPDAAGDFVALSDAIIEDYIDPNPYFNALRIYEDDGSGVPGGYFYGCIPGQTGNCAVARQALIDTINITGTLLVNYTGHGSLNFWSGESIFSTSNVPSLSNASRLPVVISMTCLDGYWTYPNFNSLTYEMLVASGKGMAGSFSPSGLGVATGHDALQEGFYQSLFDNGEWELGAASLHAKLNLWVDGGNQDLMHTFTVFGDPALGLRTPYGTNLSPGAGANSGFAGTSVTYNLTVENTGLTTDSFDFVFAGNDWTASANPPVVGPLAPNDTVPVQITVNIPPNALNNNTDTVTAIARSLGDRSKTDAAGLTTTAITNWVEVAPAAAAQSGFAGTAVNYTITLTNTHNTADHYTISLTGNAWGTSAPAALGPVAPGAVTTFQVTVNIPASALNNNTDTVTVKAASQLNPAKSDSSVLTTTAQTNWVELTPPAAAQSAFAGTAVNYTITVKNTHNTADQYTIAVSGNGWGTSAPALVGPVSPGGTTTFQVTVNIPAGALNGNSDAATVTATSQLNPGKSDTAALTTTALTNWLTVTPTAQTLFGSAGAVVTYTITVKNTTNAADSYTVSLGGQGWQTTAPAQVGPVSAGGTMTFQVAVTIPQGASPGDSDVVTVTVTSQGNPSKSAAAELETVVSGGQIFLPIVTRH
jgi:uncharacterized membrane protein